MWIYVTISDSLRDELKVPLGELVPENNANKKVILQMVRSYSYVISVGDRTTEKMIMFGAIPSLQIIDNREKRSKRAELNMNDVQSQLYCKNPAAKITTQSINAIKRAFTLKPPVRITVDGEEDLLVIPVCIYAPADSIVLYGQPDEGLVIVPITTEIRNKTQRILDKMGYDETVAV